MAPPDDQSAPPPLSVTDYYFEDPSGNPVSFAAALPVLFDGDELSVAVDALQVFLRGTASSGKVFERVVGWRLGCEDVWPELWVLAEDGRWVKLLKPWKPYEEGAARTALITLHMIHFLSRKPESSANRVLFHLYQVFSFKNEPIMDDFKEHSELIKKFFGRDELLAKSSMSAMFFLESPTNRILSEDTRNELDAKNTFIADDEVNEGLEDDDSGNSEDETHLFASVCAICDNGGDILCCEGRCLRSFHATKEAGIESNCKTLGYSSFEVEAINNFLCTNCEYKQHQCFACGLLGSSDKSVGAEVFACVNAACGHFYHPTCVARWLYRGNEAEAIACQKKIAAGGSFICPVHKCVVCNAGENKRVADMQLAMCRRCPKSYHRQCLPRKIAFQAIEEEDIKQRAWDGLLPSRILIYCLKHEMIDGFGTPMRNHLKFPEIVKREEVAGRQKKKVKFSMVEKVEDFDSRPLKKTNHDIDNTAGDIKSKSMGVKKIVSVGRSLIRSERNVTEQVPEAKSKRKYLKHISRPNSQEVDGTLQGRKKTIYKEIPKSFASTVPRTTTTRKTAFPVIRDETVKEMKALWDEATSSVTLDEIMKKRTVPSTHANSGRHIDKVITLGMIEGSVEAVRSAITTLEDGGSVEDAKAVCQPEVLRNLQRWNRKLKVYLAPFLIGPRYTSFGRHFTKVDKLMEIVDKLQWYVQDGDTVVDFCCGANDFSQLLKEKLDASAKKCSFKNYDVIQPKNDMCFEKRDWMTVEPKELPDGSQLIMGLNPPFGVKAALANKFIDKALTFKPKLIILIVPPCTERLNRKNPPYDLIWEDFRKLAGKSFYLPGAVDVEEKQLGQRNKTAPVLYLWSRQDWTQRHMGIALKQGHVASKSPSKRTPSDWMASAPLSMDYTSELRETMCEGLNTDLRSNNRSPGNYSDGWGWGYKRRKNEPLEAETSDMKGETGFSDMSISPPSDDGYGGNVPENPRMHGIQARENLNFQRSMLSEIVSGYNPAVMARHGQYSAPPPWHPCLTPAMQGYGRSYTAHYSMAGIRRDTHPPGWMGFEPQLEAAGLDQQRRSSTPDSGPPGFTPATSMYDSRFEASSSFGMGNLAPAGPDASIGFAPESQQVDGGPSGWTND